MWKVNAKPITQTVTRKLCNEFIRMTSVPEERPMSERRLMVYSRMLAEGGFRPVTWAKCLCRETGETYRVNGKHTSTLLAGCDPIPEFYVTIESYEAPTLADVARLYSTFDSKYQARTANDIYRSFASTVPALREVPGRIILLSVAGIAMSLSPESPHSDTPAERAERLLDHEEFPLWLQGITLTGEDGINHWKQFAHLNRVAVAAAMFSTWQKSVKDATIFWTAVRDETGASPSLPDRRLAKWLTTNLVRESNNHGTRRSRNESRTSREFYVRCLHSWNAWRKGQITDMKYYPQAKIPAVL